MTINENIILKLIDGGIIDINTDNDYISGCPTCDYGSEYINYIEITTTKFKACFKISRMYDYVYDDLLKIILPNLDVIKEMGELEFIQWFLNNTLEKKEEEDSSLDGLKIKYSLFDRNKNLIEKNIF